MKKFFIKAKYFVKRNIYPITVTLCTALMIGIIAISAYTSISSNNDESGNPNNVIVTDKPVTGDDSQETEEKKEEENKKEEDTTVTNPEPIVFNLPFENATISKEYTDETLIYDATTKLWCTHQGLDFACAEGQKVFAVFDGVVSKVENSMMNGTVVYLKVTDELVVVYKGLSSNLNVKEGDKIKKGQEIGTVTSMLLEKADGIHLHLELLYNDKLINPAEYFSFNK